LTTVHQSIQALGKEMARMLIGLLAGQERMPLILPTRLALRGSA
jgi:DNA-binding LacI/PurR family transcriptional regulator